MFEKFIERKVYRTINEFINPLNHKDHCAQGRREEILTEIVI